MTTSVPGGMRDDASAQTALRRRLTVLRTTAPPTCLLMMKPNLAGLTSSVLSTEVMTRDPPQRDPRRTTSR